MTNSEIKELAEESIYKTPGFIVYGFTSTSNKIVTDAGSQ